MRTARLTSQAMRMGPRSRPRGEGEAEDLTAGQQEDVATETRYPAKNTISAIFAISPGWKLSGPTRIQIREP